MSIRRFFSVKKIIWTLIILAVVGGGVYYFTRPKAVASGIQTAPVTRQDIQQTVLATGQVVSSLNLNLSFQASGVVKSVKVAEGDQVKAGQVLATLSQSSVQATLVSAQGTLASAQANYQKVLAGASSEQVNVSQKAVDAAQVNYNNAVTGLNNTKQSTTDAINQAQADLADLTSFTSQSNNKRLAVVTTIAGALPQAQSSLDLENKILADNNLAQTFSVTNTTLPGLLQAAYNQSLPLLSTAQASLNATQAYKSDANVQTAVTNSLSALNEVLDSLNYCYNALQGTVVSSRINQASIDSYKSSISTQIAVINSDISGIQTARQALSDALTNYQNAVVNANSAAVSQVAAAQSQVNSAQASLHQAQASLAQLKAQAQPADINVAKAQILSAQGQVDSAQAAFNNTILTAPSDGTVTQVDIKVGEQTNAMQEVIILQNVSSLHAEANVSEANIASLKVGQSVDYTFDALGPDQHFGGKILTINPASTVISGVVNYLVKADLNNIPGIKPGMTINMTVMVANKSKVLAVPASAIIIQDNKQYVRVIDNTKTKTYHQVEVTNGLQADGGLVEITSGLSEGQEIVTYLKS
jgi:HlyD family secretion protein